MLPRTRRLNKHNIPLPRQNTKVYHTDLFTLAVSPNTTGGVTKYAVIVSKKGMTAPERNTLRRRGYEAIGSMLPRVITGYSCVFSLKKGTNSNIPYTVFVEHMQMLFQKANLL